MPDFSCISSGISYSQHIAFADALGVTPDFLIYGTSGEKAKTKLKDADLIQQFQAIEAMDEEDKNVVKKLIDAFITKKQLQKLVQ